MHRPAAHPTLVLIHGAWQGSWSWDAWRPRLESRGWTVHAIDLPGNGCDPHDTTVPADVSLQLYTDYVVARIEAIVGPVVLVGHSGGGVIAAQVTQAVPERIACLVFLAGMMLPSGVGYGQLCQEYVQAHPGCDLGGVGPHLAWSADGLSSTVPPDAARSIFLHDCDPHIAAQAAGKLKPQPERGRAIAPTLSADRYGRVARIYVEALDDQSLRLPLQRLMQEHSPGALRLSLDCGHVPQVVQPDALTDLLCPLLEQRIHALPIPSTPELPL